MDFRDETKRLNQISIQTIGSWLGINLPANGTTNCPFSDHEDRTPSFEVKASKNRWICYGCNRSGGSIDLVKVFNGLTFVEAKQWIGSRIGKISFPPTLDVSKSAIKKTPNQNNIAAPESPPDSELYEEVLRLSPLQISGQHYLAKRRFATKTILNFKLGQIAGSNTLLAELVREYGYDRVNSAGLMTKKSTPKNARLIFPENSILCPFLENGRVVYLQARAIGSAESHGKWRNLKDCKRRIYNVDALVTRTSSKSIAICEGIFDTLSAIQLGYSAIGIMGVNTLLTEKQMALLAGKEVNILLDWDEAGEKKSKELQKEMHRFGITSTRKARPSKSAKDLNDYLIELKG